MEGPHMLARRWKSVWASGNGTQEMCHDTKWLAEHLKVSVTRGSCRIEEGKTGLFLSLLLHLGLPANKSWIFLQKTYLLWRGKGCHHCFSVFYFCTCCCSGHLSALRRVSLNIHITCAPIPLACFGFYFLSTSHGPSIQPAHMTYHICIPLSGTVHMVVACYPKHWYPLISLHVVTIQKIIT